MVESTGISVRELIEVFEFEQLTGNDDSLNRIITLADTNRPGLELAGFFEHSQTKRMVILGEKEISYIETMSIAKQKKSFDFLTSEETPALIITKNQNCPELLEKCAKKKNFPIFRTSSPTTRFIVDVVAFLDEKLASSESIHGGLLSIHGKGVLIRGESGLGKSEIALELIKRGHILVADDRVDCYRIHNKIVGMAPEILKDMLEIRGIGIINVTKMFGISSVMPKTEINFQVTLEAWDKEKDYDRIGTEEAKHESILGVDIPKIVVPVREGRSMAVIIESAVTNFMLKEMGMDSAKEFEERVIQFIEKAK